MKLRPYQQRAHDEMVSWFFRNATGNPIISAATGSGKSHLIAALIQYALQFPNERVLMLTHSKELVEQDIEKLLAAWPDAPVGVLSASLGRKDIDCQIIMGTIGTMANYADDIGYSTLGIVDECHRVNNDPKGQYRRFMDTMLSYNPTFRVVGYTATPFRGNGCWLHSGPNTLFDDVCATVGMRELLDDGYLAPLVNAPTDARIDTSGVLVQAGEYNLKQLEEVSDDEEITRKAVSEILRYYKEQNRNHGLIYTVSVAHGEHVTEEFKRQGEPSISFLTGKTPKKVRAKMLTDFKQGRTRFIVSIGTLTTGFDAPNVDLIALLRPTKSLILAVQMPGRGTRLCEGKTDCLFLDFTSTLEDLGPVDLIKGRAYRKPQEDTEAPYKLCPECGAKNSPKAYRCISCNAMFPPPETPIHKPKPTNAPVLSTSGGKLSTVDRITYQRHDKPGKPSSVRVTYWNGLLVEAEEWVCPEHPSGWAKNKAMGWLRRRGIYLEAPTIDDVLEAADQKRIEEPKAITYRKNGRYTEITGYIFE